VVAGRDLDLGSVMVAIWLSVMGSSVVKVPSAWKLI